MRYLSRCSFLSNFTILLIYSCEKSIEPIPPILFEDKIAFSSYRYPNYEIYIMDIDGSNQVNLTQNDNYDGYSVFSPDGSKIAFHSRRDDQNLEIYIMDIDGNNQIKLTQSDGLDENPVFSPDGSKIVFVSERYNNQEIYLMNIDGSNQTNLTNNPYPDGEPTFRPKK